MKFCIITHVQHIKDNNNYYGYAPYIREMNIWLKYVDEVIVVAPLIENKLNPIYENYLHSKLTFNRVSEFNITSISNGIRTVFRLPKLFSAVYSAMYAADHIHLRCPGNMGLIGALVQILFPNKQKTAKYAGNWDPKSKQPWSYRLQRWILSNTFLTKNMQVLVYGEWPNQTKNIKPFFTATYSVDEIQNSEFRIQKKWALQSESIITESDFDSAQSNKLGDSALSVRAESRTKNNSFSFLFVGTLSSGKQPLYALQLVHELQKKGFKATLKIYGEGSERTTIEEYIKQYQLDEVAFLLGNQSKEIVLKAYQESHFLLLPSKSEGWPKVVAEAMFWGCVPIVTSVSCVPYMLDYGNRGVLLTTEIAEDTNAIISLINNPDSYTQMAFKAQSWSRQFTTDKFEEEITKLVK